MRVTTHRQMFLQALAHTSEFPLALEIVRAEGLYLYAPDGKKYMDMISGIAVSNLGHCHPRVVEAVCAQAKKYMHLMVYGEYIQAPQVELADMLTQHLPNTLNCVYFVNSGTEAIEGALKLAKRATGRPKIISCYNSYHGSTHGALSVMGNEAFKQAYRPLLPGVEFIRFGDPKDIEKIDRNTACVLMETVQGESGVQVADSTYFKVLRDTCTQVGALLILDEIQTGIGRTGTLWAFEKYAVVPDILVLAKGLGGGMPLGAFIASKELMRVLQNNPMLGHITTFGGHPVSCAAAKATIEVITQSTLIEEVSAKEALFRKTLVHGSIKEIRSAGLMIAVSFKDFETLQTIIAKCMDRGIITDWFLHNTSSMRLAPPLIITEPEIIQACETIVDILEELKL